MKKRFLVFILILSVFVCSACDKTVDYETFKKEINTYCDMLDEKQYVNYFETNRITIGDEVITQNSKIQYRNDVIFLQQFKVGDEYPYIYHHEDTYFGISEIHFNGEFVQIEKSSEDIVKGKKLTDEELLSRGTDRKVIKKDNKYIVSFNYGQLTNLEKVIVSRSFDDVKISTHSHFVNEIELTFSLLDNSIEYTLSFDFKEIKNENNIISYYSERKISFDEFEKYSYEYFPYEDNIGGAKTLLNTKRKTNFDNSFVVHKSKGFFYGYLKKNVYKLMEKGTTPTQSMARVNLYDENKKSINNLLAKKFNPIGFDKWNSVINIEEDGYYYIHINSNKNFEGYFENISFENFPEDSIEPLNSTSGSLSFVHDHLIFTNELNVDKVYIITNKSNKSIYINQVEIKAGGLGKYYSNGANLIYYIVEHISTSESDYPYEYDIDVYSYEVNYNAAHTPEEITSEFSSNTYHTVHNINGGPYFTFNSKEEGKYKIEFEYINKFGEISAIKYYDKSLIGSGIITSEYADDDCCLYLLANKTYMINLDVESPYDYIEFKVRIIYLG